MTNRLIHFWRPRPNCGTNLYGVNLTGATCPNGWFYGNGSGCG